VAFPVKTPGGGSRIYTTTWDANHRFRRLNAPHLLARVYAGVRYVDGVEAPREVAA
jgi:hypothetical protein